MQRSAPQSGSESYRIYKEAPRLQVFRDPKELVGEMLEQRDAGADRETLKALLAENIEQWRAVKLYTTGNDDQENVGQHSRTDLGFVNPNREPSPILDEVERQIRMTSVGLRASQNPRLAEFGCGNGVDGVELVKRISYLKYEGFDIAGPALEVAREKLASVLGERCYPRGGFYQFDYRKWLDDLVVNPHVEEGLKARTGLTHILSISSLHYFLREELELVFAKIAAVLRPTRGQLILALKLAESDDVKRHEVIYEEGGWYHAIDTEKNTFRIFPGSESVVVGTLMNSRFRGSSISCTNVNVPNYDREGETARFLITVAQPADLPPSSGDGGNSSQIRRTA